MYKSPFSSIVRPSQGVSAASVAMAARRIGIPAPINLVNNIAATDVITGAICTQSGLSVSPQLSGLYTAATGRIQVAKSPLFNAARGTVLIAIYPTQLSDLSDYMVFSIGTSASDRLMLGYFWGGASLAGWYGCLGRTGSPLDYSAYSGIQQEGLNSVLTIVFSWNNSGNHRMWTNGKKRNSSSYSDAPTLSTGYNYASLYNGAIPLYGHFLFGAVFAGHLSDSECVLLSNRWPELVGAPNNIRTVPEQAPAYSPYSMRTQTQWSLIPHGRLGHISIGLGGN